MTRNRRIRIGVRLGHARAELPEDEDMLPVMLSLMDDDANELAHV